MAIGFVNRGLKMFDRRFRQEQHRTDRKRQATKAVLRRFEVLEERWLMATYSVTNTNDLGLGSLRDGINTVNLDSIGPNEIDFNIAGTAVHSIMPGSPLPSLSSPTFLNGYSQPGSSENTLAVGDNAVLKIEINGTKAGTGTNGLSLAAGGNTISGLTINNFQGSAVTLGSSVTLQGGSNILFGNFLGSDPTGTTAAQNGSPLYLTQNNTIGGSTPGARNLIQPLPVFSFR